MRFIDTLRKAARMGCFFYSIDLTGYDVVIGYRADDSYFQYAESFVSNTLPLRSLNKALKLGKLGEQTVVISQKGFDRLHFVNAYPVSKSVYYYS